VPSALGKGRLIQAIRIAPEHRRHSAYLMPGRRTVAARDGDGLPAPTGLGNTLRDRVPSPVDHSPSATRRTRAPRRDFPGVEHGCHRPEFRPRILPGIPTWETSRTCQENCAPTLRTRAAPTAWLAFRRDAMVDTIDPVAVWGVQDWGDQDGSRSHAASIARRHSYRVADEPRCNTVLERISLRHSEDTSPPAGRVAGPPAAGRRRSLVRALLWCHDRVRRSVGASDTLDLLSPLY
jgi:hypothetical protein